ncbi:hypothetical protein MTBLM5_410009 [Magnetospirillum sp. LM-5]|nr:hypothetical protein MTBLM5_410009 [Magnetospirillum sp. LM-5]
MPECPTAHCSRKALENRPGQHSSSGEPAARRACDHGGEPTDSIRSSLVSIASGLVPVPADAPAVDRWEAHEEMCHVLVQTEGSDGNELSCRSW